MYYIRLSNIYIRFWNRFFSKIKDHTYWPTFRLCLRKYNLWKDSTQNFFRIFLEFKIFDQFLCIFLVKYNLWENSKTFNWILRSKIFIQILSQYLSEILTNNYFSSYLCTIFCSIECFSYNFLNSIDIFLSLYLPLAVFALLYSINLISLFFFFFTSLLFYYLYIYFLQISRNHWY